MDYEDGEVKSYNDSHSYDSRGGQSERKRKSHFSGTSIYEREARKDGSRDRSDRNRSRDRSHRSHHHHSDRRYRSRSRSGSRSPYRSNRDYSDREQEKATTQPAPNQPATTEATTEQSEPVVEDPNNVHKQCERAADEARKRAMTILRKRGLLQMEEQPTEDENKDNEKTEEEAAPKPAPVNPLLAQVSGNTNGIQSWYKPATTTTATALKSILENAKEEEKN